MLVVMFDATIQSWYEHRNNWF